MRNRIFPFLSLLVFFLTMAPSNALNCSGIVQVENEGLLNYLASVTFTVPKDLEGDWTLDMEMDVPFTFLGGWGVWIKSSPLEGKASFRSRLENNTLAVGDQISFRFRISWFRDDPKPLVTSLKWEGVQLCTEFKDSVEPVKASRRRRTDSDRQGSVVARRVNYRKRYYINI